MSVAPPLQQATIIWIELKHVIRYYGTADREALARFPVGEDKKYRAGKIIKTVSKAWAVGSTNFNKVL